MSDEPQDTKDVSEPLTPKPKAKTKTTAKARPKSAKKAASKTATKASTKSASKPTASKKTTAKTSSAPASARDVAAPGDQPKPENHQTTTASVNSDAGNASSSGQQSAPPSTPEESPAPRAVLLGAGAGFVAALVTVLMMGAFGLGSGGSATQARLDQLSSDVDRLALSNGDPSAVGNVQMRLTAVEEDLRALNAGAARASDLQDVEQTLADVAARVQSLGTGGNALQSTGSVATLETRIDEFDQVLAQTVDAFNGRIGAIEEATPADLQARLNAMISGAEFSVLEQRVGQLEDDQLAQDMRRAALALALAQLSRATESSGSFAAELEAVAALRPDDPYVAQLRSVAAGGIATRGMLSSEFPSVRRRVAAADRAARYSGPFSSFWGWLSNLVTIQRTADVEGTSVDAILTRAEARLDEDNLAAAVGEVASLPEAAAEPAQGWLTDASARVSIDRLIAALSRDVLGDLEQ